jgi:hypothetical protein
MNPIKLYHLSEEPNIKVFEPRPSPSHYGEINADVVFVVSDKFLYNYLLPRDCPRVTYYVNNNSSQEDINTFMGQKGADYVVTVESKWKSDINGTTLYCYEFLSEGFLLLDENAGYYISYKSITPISVRTITNLQKELSDRNVELRYIPSLFDLAERIQQSTLSFSLIRMRNAS